MLPGVAAEVLPFAPLVTSTPGRINPLGRGHFTVIGFIRMFFFLSHLFFFLDGIMVAAANRSQISCQVLPADLQG